MSDLSGFRKFIEAAPTMLSTLDDELGISQDNLSTFYSREPIILANIKLPDGTYHSLLPVKIVPDSITDKTVTVVIDDTYSPNLNDKVLRKSNDKLKKVPSWEREEQKLVLPLTSKTKDGGTLQSVLSQGWTPPPGGGMGGGGMGMPF